MARSAHALALGASVLTLLAAACSNDDLKTPNEPLFKPGTEAVQAMAVAPSYLVGDTATLVQYSGVAKEAAKKGTATTWAISNSTVGSISSKGLFRALAAGSARVTVAASGYADTINVSVASKTVASVSVTAPTTSVSIGSSVSLTATARDAAGTAIPGLTATWSSSSATVGTVSSAGAFTGVSAGSAAAKATISGVTGSLAMTVTSAQSSSSSTAIAAPIPPALLSFTFPRVTGKSWYATSPSSLQAAINAAARGDEIVLPAGMTFTGNFVLPAKSGTAANGWILIRSEKLSSLPPQGTRVHPTMASLMPKLVSPSVAPALRTDPYANGYWVSGVEITVVPTLTNYVQYGLVRLGHTGTSQNVMAQVPSNLVLDRVYIHGQSSVQLIRCVALNSARTQVTDSYLNQCHAKGFDSQAIGGWNGPGPFKIVNNMLAGAGENVLFGGGDPSITNLVPSDVEFRRNYVYTPASWKGVWTKKNLFETKNVQRVLIEENVFEGSWADGQTGIGFVLKVSNQSGSCTWCTVTDLTIRNNVVRNVAGAVTVMGYASQTPLPVAGPLSRVLFEGNVISNVNVGPYTGEGRIIRVMNNARDVNIRNNTMSTTGTLTAFLDVGTNPAATNFNWENNVASYGSYGFYSSWFGVGETSLKAFRGSISMKGYGIIGAYRSGYPNGAFYSSLSGIPSGKGAAVATVTSLTQGIDVP